MMQMQDSLKLNSNSLFNQDGSQASLQTRQMGEQMPGMGGGGMPGMGGVGAMGGMGGMGGGGMPGGMPPGGMDQMQGMMQQL